MIDELIERARERYQQAIRDLSNREFWRQWNRDRDRAAFLLRAHKEQHDGR